ncbi:MAG: hypothetical protein LUG12_09775 [Erysipelotrichaceae bacterium]|nr:hypothetical protein [Erysipelotrichaceae bacterium]
MLYKESYECMIESVLEYANDAFEDYQMNTNDKFNEGRKDAYCELLDILRNEFGVSNEELTKYGLNDVDKFI